MQGLGRFMGDGKNHEKLDDFKEYYDNAYKYGKGFKHLNQGITTFTKKSAETESIYKELASRYLKVHQECMNVNQMKTYSIIFSEMSDVFGKIAEDHENMRLNIEKYPSHIKNVANVQRLKDAQNEIKNCENDLNRKNKNRENAEMKLRELGNRDDSYFNIGDAIRGRQNVPIDDLIRKQKDDVEERKRDVERAESKLTESIEHAKSEVLKFDAESVGLHRQLIEMTENMKIFHMQAAARLENLQPSLNKNYLEYAPRFTPMSLRLSEGLGHVSEKTSLALPVEITINLMLQNDCFNEEGLFRLPGATSKVNIICDALNSPSYCSKDEYYGTLAHIEEKIQRHFSPYNQDLASVLKKFFRDLCGSHPKREPYALLKDLDETDALGKIESLEPIKESGNKQRLELIREEINKQLTRPERYNLAYLCRFCHEIKKNQAKNKMSSNALAICWAPTLIGRPYPDGKGTFCVQEMIEHADQIFLVKDYPELEKKFDFELSQKTLNENRQKIHKISRGDNERANEVLAGAYRKKAPIPSPGITFVGQNDVRVENVQILRSGTPNLSNMRNNAQARPRSYVSTETVATHVSAPRATVAPDYTGFGFLAEDDRFESESDFNRNSSRDSMASELESMWNNKSNDMNRRPKKTPPPLPPAPRSNATVKTKPAVKPKPRTNRTPRNSDSSDQVTPM